MSNLASAKAAIEAEIAHAKKGLAHFYSRIEALEMTLSHLVAVDRGVLDEQAAATAASAKTPAKAAKAQPATPTKSAKSSKELPATGGDYWPALITDQPQSAPDILNAAIRQLGFTPTKEQKQKLAGRMTFAINALVKAKKIQDSGTGRERRFFKA